MLPAVPGIIASQAARFATCVKAIFNGKGSSLLNVLPFVAPSFELTSDRPCLLALRGEWLWSLALSGTAAAAQFPTIWFGTGDTSIMVIEQLIIQSSTAQAVRIEATALAMPGVPAGVNFDDKRVNGGRFKGQGVFESNVGPVFALDRLEVNLAANVPFVFPCRYIAQGQRKDRSTPGHFRVQGQTAATNLIVSARGYGRQVEDSESGV